MTRLLSSMACVAFAIACGGQTVQNGDAGDADAGPDVSVPISECHGYCPQPNGAICGSDCDCYNKCLSGTDKPSRCGDPIVEAIACGDDAAACPAGQACGAFGACEGATCGASDDCPLGQQCVGEKCSVVGCI